MNNFKFEDAFYIVPEDTVPGKCQNQENSSSIDNSSELFRKNNIIENFDCSDS